MPILTQLALLGLLAFLAFLASYRKADLFLGAGTRLDSLPTYHASLVALTGLIPALLVFCLWSAVNSAYIRSTIVAEIPAEFATSGQAVVLAYSEISSIAAGNTNSANFEQLSGLANQLLVLEQRSRILKAVAVTAIAILGFVFAFLRIAPAFKARERYESLVKWLLWASASLAVLTTLGIVFSVLFEAIRFFDAVPFFDFVFGTHWSPQTAVRPDQIGSSGSFGAVPLFVGTLLISAIAMLVAVPVGLMSAIYLSEYASSYQRDLIKPLLEVLAGIPTVVYGFFAAITVAPYLRDLGSSLGLDVASESALAAGVVMGIMIIPFVSSLSDDVINAVPQPLREGALGLGSTKYEMIRLVVIPAALPGIISSILLAVSRAVGETMIVVMAAGLAAKLTANPFEAVTTVTVQIVTLLVGDQEFDSPKTLAAFALGLMLFITTLVLNVIALAVVRRYREQYE